MPIKLTPSNLAYWFDSQCPAAWAFDQEWESLESKEWADRGTLVHSMMEGTVNPAAVVDKMAVTFHEKLVTVSNQAGWKTVLDSDGQPMNEVKHRFRLAPGVDLSRKLDRMVIDIDGENAVVDWKTTPGYGWKPVVDARETLRYPQAHGFQSIGYLLPPPKEDWTRLRIPKKLKWPKRILYIVAPLRGPTQVIQYDWSEEAYQNFVWATEVAIPSIKRKHFPKIAGKHCHTCRYKALCWQTPGWESGFRRRGTPKVLSEVDGEDTAA